MSLSQSPHSVGDFPDLMVAAVQMEPQVGAKASNIARSLQAIERAAKQGAAVIVLPELTSSGYVFASREEAFSLAETVAEGDATQAWTEAARRLNVHVVAGLAERDGDRLFNSAIVAGPRGLVGRYRKLHLWANEHLFFEPGDLGCPVFHTEIGRIAAVICYDGWFPETYRMLAALGADIVCIPTNWVPMPEQPTDGLAMANVLVMANAHSNGLNVICANRIGIERGQPFIGRSVIVGAQGWPLAGPASADGEEILIARINLKQSRQARHLNPFNDVLRDRRDDVYGAVPISINR
jgi:N-carbamoylputrescine amidase